MTHNDIRDLAGRIVGLHARYIEEMDGYAVRYDGEFFTSTDTHDLAGQLADYIEEKDTEART